MRYQRSESITPPATLGLPRRVRPAPVEGMPEAFRRWTLYRGPLAVEDPYEVELFDFFLRAPREHPDRPGLLHRPERFYFELGEFFPPAGEPPEELPERLKATAAALDIEILEEDEVFPSVIIVPAETATDPRLDWQKAKEHEARPKTARTTWH